jgi:type IV pilus assembly protein PilY1
MFPVDDVCAPGGSGYVNAINAFTGARLKNPFFDLDDDGNFQEHAIGGVFASSFQVESGFGKPGSPLLIGNRLVLGGTGGGTLLTRGVSTGLTPLLGRIAWREIVRN